MMGKLFKSSKQRKREERRERRRAFRDAENRIDDVKDRIKRMQREADKQWQEAREAMKAGQKATAQRLIKSYRGAQVLMTKLEQKRWVFEQYLSKMEAAGTDQEFAGAMAKLNKVIEINPEMVADVFDEASGILGEQVDADRFWERLYDREMDGATGQMEDHIPDMNDLEKQLEDEAAAEVGGGAAERIGGSLDEREASGRERIRKLLDRNQSD
jgi:hypothetical protein